MSPLAKTTLETLLYRGSTAAQLETVLDQIDVDTCDADGENAFFVADLAMVYRQYMRWVRELPDGALPTAVEATLTRILGEVITNATKHAPGAELEVAVHTDQEALTMTATNPLPRAGWSEGAGDGLRNIAFRAQSIGGTATAGPHDGAWVVRATIPMEVAR